MSYSSPSIDAARKLWADRLIDTSRRNNLLYFQSTKTRALDLTLSQPEILRKLLNRDKGTIYLRDLMLPISDTELRTRVSAIRKRALVNLEEKGLETLYLTYGAATWQNNDKSRQPRAAVALFPVDIKQHGTQQTIQITGDPQINLALLYVLNSEFGCSITAEEILGISDTELSDCLSMTTRTGNPVFDRLRDAARHIPGFDIQPDVFLSNFSFQKMAMLRDIREFGGQIASHPVLAALAGVPSAREDMKKMRRDVKLTELDKMPPEKEFLILDADSSQQRVIASASKMQSGVIQGPPGTGKSQTIVNLITTFAAQGKRVLFVAEKRAALQVVKDRLENNGLGNLVLDLHGADISSREIMEKITQSMNAVGQTLPVHAEKEHRDFTDSRDRLNAHVMRLHSHQGTQNRSIFDLQGDLLKLAGCPRSVVRWRNADLERLTPEIMEHLRHLFTEARGISDLFLRWSTSSWTHAKLSTGEAAQRALDATRDLYSRLLPDIDTAIGCAVQQTSLRKPQTYGDLMAFASLMTDLAEASRLYKPHIFSEPIDHIASITGAANTGLKRAWAKLTSAEYRTALKTLRSCRTTVVSDTDAQIEAARLNNIRNRWRQTAESHVQLPDNHIEIVSLAKECADHIATLRDALPGRFTDDTTLNELLDKSMALALDSYNALRIPQARFLEAQVQQALGDAFLRELARNNVPPEDWQNVLDKAIAESLLDKALAVNPEIASFNGENHQELIKKFRKHDKERMQIAIARVKRAHAEHVMSVRAQKPDENDLVKTQTHKKKNRLQLRELLARAPNVLTALFPCWMTSPLSISQLLKAERRYFDVVLFDEASQILPEDAIPAIMRAEHVIVAGDNRQLPPTAFFASGNSDLQDEEADSESVDGFESLLDLMSSICETWSLDWHYRSRDESLISFSNHHLYQNRLLTFPGPLTGKALRHELIKPTNQDNLNEFSSANEASRVVEMALEHARNRPHRSLGIITMGIKHANRIEEALELAIARNPDVESFFDPQKSERFFVKNLERVQGDERDDIIISIGYTKNANGKLAYRFGPLLREGGERRLNVAITRARRKITLVSSFGHLDMDPERSNARGVELLRLYLQYAASHGQKIGEGKTKETIQLNPFEKDVYDALSLRGISLIPQWGESGYRIDFVAQHPDRPDQFVLAIECDGPSYRSAATARDRDRLRPQILKSLGWRVCRIWSTDWFNHREREIERVFDIYQKALRNEKPLQTTTTLLASSKPAITEQQELTGSVKQSKPVIPIHSSIDEYVDTELIQIAIWVLSDGKLRDNDELFEAIFNELPFKQRGAKIKRRINGVIAELIQQQRIPGRQTEISMESVVPEFQFLAHRTPNSRSARTLVIGLNGSSVSVEQFALQHLEQDGFVGWHTENIFWWQMMALFYNDVLLGFQKNSPFYSRNDLPPGLFSPQKWPGDLKTGIEKRSQELREMAKAGKLGQVVAQALANPNTPKIRWFRDRSFAAGDYDRVVEAMPPDILISLLHDLIMDYPAKRNGFPDLFVIGHNKIRFIEVKQAQEKISPEQIERHAKLRKFGLSVEICRVLVA